MSCNIDTVNKKISVAEESYRNINGAWISCREIKSRIDSLIILAKELKAIENKKAD